MWTSLDVVSSIGQESLAPEFKLTHHVVPKRLVLHLWSPSMSVVPLNVCGPPQCLSVCGPLNVCGSSNVCVPPQCPQCVWSPQGVHGSLNVWSPSMSSM